MQLPHLHEGPQSIGAVSESQGSLRSKAAAARLEIGLYHMIHVNWFWPLWRISHCIEDFHVNHIAKTRLDSDYQFPKAPRTSQWRTSEIERDVRGPKGVFSKCIRIRMLHRFVVEWSVSDYGFSLNITVMVHQKAIQKAKFVSLQILVNKLRGKWTRSTSAQY
jgi:hypothetical protein